MLASHNWPWERIRDETMRECPMKQAPSVPLTHINVFSSSRLVPRKRQFLMSVSQWSVSTDVDDDGAFASAGQSRKELEGSK